MTVKKSEAIDAIAHGIRGKLPLHNALERSQVAVAAYEALREFCAKESANGKA